MKVQRSIQMSAEGEGSWQTAAGELCPISGETLMTRLIMEGNQIDVITTGLALDLFYLYYYLLASMKGSTCEHSSIC